jgi:hypothetical protein
MAETVDAEDKDGHNGGAVENDAGDDVEGNVGDVWGGHGGRRADRTLDTFIETANPDLFVSKSTRLFQC